MDVIVTSPRAIDAGPHPARAAAAALAADLARGGDTVRWVVPVVPGEPLPTEQPGVRVLPARAEHVGFRDVQGRLGDLPTERVLNAELRTSPPDLLHIHGFGGAVTYMLSWLADRLGVPVVVVASPIEESLCHRGSLVDETGEDCDSWDRPERCAACCRFAAPRRPGAVASAFAALARAAGPLSPFPTPTDFENRLDMVVQGLASASAVCVDGEDAASALARAGVPRRLIRVGLPAATAAAWRPVHEAVLSASSAV